VIGPGWLELERTVRSSPVVVPGIFGHHAAQVPFAEDKHPVGDLRTGGEYESFRMGVGRRRRLHPIQMIGTGVSG
jgi:hypothetical protein